MDALRLTPADVLKIRSEPDTEKPAGAYIVRKIWLNPVTLPGDIVAFKTTGFTLLHTTTLTDREVSIEDLQIALDEQQLIPFYPETVRRVTGLTPRDYHKKPNGTIRKTL